MLIVSIDPGIRGCGVAAFSEAELLHADYVLNPQTRGNGILQVLSMARAIRNHLDREGVYTPHTVVAERPQVYDRTKSRGDPNDLVPLEGIGACLAGLFDPQHVAGYLPREWKGTIDPEEISRRVRSRLSTIEFSRRIVPGNTCSACTFHRTEQDCLKPDSCLAHNVHDAIGIGLKYLGRFEPLKVIAR